MCCWCLIGVSLFGRCPVLLPLIVTDVREVPAVLSLDFGPIICSSQMHGAFCLHPVPQGLHLHSPAVLHSGSSFLLTCLATHVAALKTLLFNTEEPNSSHSIRILPLSPPPFPSSFPPELHNGNQNLPGIRGGLPVFLLLLQAGEPVCFLPGCLAVP